MMRPSSELGPGDRFHRFDVIDKIGEGGFAVVYELRHRQSALRAALKVLKILALSNQPEIIKRFQNEARAANAVRHPAIVNILDQGHFDDGGPWLLMEFIEGETLEERIEAVLKGRTPLHHDPIAILYQLADVLRVLHERGIIHRDLKPANIKLMPDPTRPEGELVKLLDFGIAKFTSESLLEPHDEGAIQPKTRVGLIMGTPSYMAPEQCVSAANVTAAADVYALGVMAYELLCGHKPFDAAAPAIYMSKLQQDAPPLAAPGVPDDLSQLVMSMLRRDVTLRPTMAAVAERLALLGGRGASGAQLRALKSASTTSVSPRSAQRRNRALWLLGGALLTLGVGIAGHGLGHGTHRPNGNALLLVEDSFAVSVQDGAVLHPATSDMAAQATPAPDLAAPDLMNPVLLEPELLVFDLATPDRVADLAPRPPNPRVKSCEPQELTPDCFPSHSLSGEQRRVLVSAANAKKLRLCARQTLTLQRSMHGFLTCTVRPSAVQAQTCDRFIDDAYGKWGSLPIPDQVEIKCPSK